MADEYAREQHRSAPVLKSLTSFVGGGAPRYWLSSNPEPQLPNYGTAGKGPRLKAGMVLAITGYVWQQGIGAVFRQDSVLITDDGVKVLTTSPSWPGDA